MLNLSGSGGNGKPKKQMTNDKALREWKREQEYDRTCTFLERLQKKYLKPLDDLTVTEWAEKKRRLSTEASAEPGPWRTSRTPYLREIMDSFTDPKIRRIVMVAASQVGKSEMINNIIGYIIDEDPGSILFVHPTTIDAKEFSKLRIAPMIRDSPSLAEKVVAPKSRETGNTILQKTYPGGILTMCGSTEAHSLASKPIRYVFGDERDRWALSAGTEGDPWSLAMARQKTFYNAKAVEVSTPTVKGKSAIEASYATGTMERWKSRCPNCGEFHEIQFKDIRYEYETTVVNNIKTFNVTKVFYICPDCGFTFSETEMKRQPARWEAENPTAIANGVRSFWLNAFVSAWASWESIILEYLQAIGDTRKLQVVYNTAFGQLWEDRGDVQDEDELMERREEYEADLPEGVLLLTAGVDTQDDRLEYEIVGHGHFGETWGIDKGIVMGRPDSPAVWRDLEEHLGKALYFKDGLGLRVSSVFVDSGGHFTQNVREECRRRLAKQWYSIKGRGGQDIPYTSPPKKRQIVINGKLRGTCWEYEIGVDAGKQIIMDNLKVQTPGSKYCHFPKRDEYGFGYFKGLLSEHLVYEPERKHPWIWVKIPGHERNEALDCRNYAMAAFRAMAPNMDALAARIKAARGTNIEPVEAPKPSVVQKPKRQSRTIKNYFEEW